MNTSYVFEIWQYGNKIGIKRYDDFKSAQQYYCNSYFQYDYAVVPFVNGKQLTFNEAYDYFDIVKYHMYHFGRTN